MRTIIAGGRDFAPTAKDWATLDRLRTEIPITKVVSGGARGADHFGERWARSRGVELVVINANWRTLGRRAGPFRNEMMASYAQALVAFPGGKGTRDMIGRAHQHGLVVHVIPE